jgi:hypothetical protein
MVLIRQWRLILANGSSTRRVTVLIGPLLSSKLRTDQGHWNSPSMVATSTRSSLSKYLSWVWEILWVFVWHLSHEWTTARMWYSQKMQASILTIILSYENIGTACRVSSIIVHQQYDGDAHVRILFRQTGNLQSFQQGNGESTDQKDSGFGSLLTSCCCITLTKRITSDAGHIRGVLPNSAIS